MGRRGGLIEAVDLALPHLPAELEGLQVLHLSDLHIQRKRPRYDQIAELLADQRADLALLTGDYITDPGDEPAAVEVMTELCRHLDPPLGVYGVFGNHDTYDLRQRFNALPVRWLDNRCHRPDPALPIEIIGFETDECRWPDALDVVEQLVPGSPNGNGNGRGRRVEASQAEQAGDMVRPEQAGGSAHADQTAQLAQAAQGGQPAQADHDAGAAQPAQAVQQPAQADCEMGPRPVRLLLCHYPTFLPTAADLRIDVMFSGHTHGGQCRLPGPGRPRPFANSCDLPNHLTSGIFRHRDTLCVVSRGLGENILPFRMFCPPHLLVYTLRRGPSPGRATDHVENVVPW